MQWGHGDDDYSAVVRKYSLTNGADSRDETEMKGEGGQADVEVTVEIPESADPLVDLDEAKPEKENDNAS
jgi:hypothetical protein